MHNEPLPESTELADLLLNAEQKQIVERAAGEIEEKPDTYDLGFFWKLDSSVGGIGGYCMSFNPVNTPFPGGIGRVLFRPLQYAAANIEWNKNICGNYSNARSAVHDSGLYLEVVAKYVIRRRTFPMIPMWSWKSTLGTSVHYLAQNGTLPHDKAASSVLLAGLYNKSKHDTNQDDKRERLFCPADALISYISARILGEGLLRPYYREILKRLGSRLGELHDLNCST